VGCILRRGNCYVTAEALYHLLGGKAAHLTPHTVRHEGDVHWYLVFDVHRAQPGSCGGDISIIIDPTRKQFKTAPPYHLGRGRGFLTAGPSARTAELMGRMLWSDRDDHPNGRCGTFYASRSETFTCQRKTGHNGPCAAPKRRRKSKRT
jgi:hypothetical protein